MILKCLVFATLIATSACKSRGDAGQILGATELAGFACPLSTWNGTFDAAEPKIEAGSRLSYHVKAAAEIADWPAYAVKRYGPDAVPILACLLLLGVQYSVLVVDPGVVAHAAEFFKYAAAQKSLPKNPWQMRQVVSDGLGARSVVRGMTLDDASVKAIDQDGLLSSHMRKKRGAPDMTIYQGDAVTQLRFRLQASLNRLKDVYVSITDYDEVAESVSAGFSDPTKKVYLYRLKIPRLDLVHLSADPAIFRYADDWLETLKANMTYEIRYKDGHKRDLPVDERLESMAFLKIDRNEILSWKVVEDSQIQAAGWEFPQ